MAKENEHLDDTDKESLQPYTQRSRILSGLMTTLHITAYIVLLASLVTFTFSPMMGPIIFYALINLILTPIITIHIESLGVKTEYQDQPLMKTVLSTIKGVPVAVRAVEPTVEAVQVDKQPVEAVPVGRPTNVVEAVTEGELPSYKEVVCGNSRSI